MTSAGASEGLPYRWGSGLHGPRRHPLWVFPGQSPGMGDSPTRDGGNPHPELSRFPATRQGRCNPLWIRDRLDTESPHGKLSI